MLSVLMSLAATPVLADAGNDYVACLVGRAAVVLHGQKKPDGGKALEAAFKRCAKPKGISENELDGISDYASLMVEAMGNAR